MKRSRVCAAAKAVFFVRFVVRFFVRLSVRSGHGRYTARMRLVGQLYITVPGARVKRDPTFMEKLKRGFGGQVDLDTEEVQNQLEATSVVDAVRRALGRLGVGNAL